MIHDSLFQQSPSTHIHYSHTKKSFKLAHIKYKAELVKQREETEADKRTLKLKRNVEELENTKKPKNVIG